MHSAKLSLNWLLLAVIFVMCFYFISYYTPRTNFYVLVTFYSIAFTSFYLLLNHDYGTQKDLFAVGFIVRVILLFALPNLSQDFYRFIWDGHIVLNGNSPYSFTPNEIINSSNFSFPNKNALYNGMGALSAKHFSNYPPFNQLCFLLGAWIGAKSIWASAFVFKLIILLTDIGIYFFGKRILVHLKLPTKNIFFYFLNPLVIIELASNLHFEGVMICFILMSIYFVLQNKLTFAAIALALSISVKLFPLIILPLFLRYFKPKQLFQFYGIIGLLNVLLFLPFLSAALIKNYSQTIALWFVNFEFNASLYYIARAIGFKIVGYNVIHTIGKITPVITIVFILFISIRKKILSMPDLLQNAMLVFFVYLLLSTTVHPWYIITPLVFSLFTTYRFLLIWSFTIILSYFAYSQPQFKENFWLIFIEYAFVFSFLAWELFVKPNRILKEINSTS
jgi:alpha-1,6-mannosyltransferase